MSERTVCIHAGHHTLCCQDCADIKNESLRKELADITELSNAEMSRSADLQKEVVLYQKNLDSLTADLKWQSEQNTELKSKLDEAVRALEKIEEMECSAQHCPDGCRCNSYSFIAEEILQKLSPSKAAGEGEKI